MPTFVEVPEIQGAHGSGSSMRAIVAAGRPQGRTRP